MKWSIMSCQFTLTSTSDFNLLSLSRCWAWFVFTFRHVALTSHFQTLSLSLSSSPCNFLRRNLMCLVSSLNELSRGKTVLMSYNQQVFKLYLSLSLSPSPVTPSQIAFSISLKSLIESYLLTLRNISYIFWRDGAGATTELITWRFIGITIKGMRLVWTIGCLYVRWMDRTS